MKGFNQCTGTHGRRQRGGQGGPCSTMDFCTWNI